MFDVSVSALLCISFIRERKQQGPVDVTVATKFAALPWRFGRGSVLSALKKSLERLGLPSVELYQLHWSVICFFLSFSESVICVAPNYYSSDFADDHLL
jgi:diketogulonate reductase-like aldo/keto reductase